MYEVDHAGGPGVNDKLTPALAAEYPKPPYVARLDFEAWCWHKRNEGDVIGEVARYVLWDVGRGCWPETRRMDGFHRANYDPGAVGRLNIWCQHLATKHNAGPDSTILTMLTGAHEAYLADMARYWRIVERTPGEAPDLAEVLDL